MKLVADRVGVNLNGRALYADGHGLYRRIVPLAVRIQLFQPVKIHPGVRSRVGQPVMPVRNGFSFAAHPADGFPVAAVLTALHVESHIVVFAGRGPLQRHLSGYGSGRPGRKGHRQGHKAVPAYVIKRLQGQSRIVDRLAVTQKRFHQLAGKGILIPVAVGGTAAEGGGCVQFGRQPAVGSHGEIARQVQPRFSADRTAFEQGGQRGGWVGLIQDIAAAAEFDQTGKDGRVPVA